MSAYDDALAAPGKALCTVWDFPDLQTRFVTEVHPGLTLPGGWIQFDRAHPEKDSGSSADLLDGKLEVGSAKFSIPDTGEALTRWLSDHEIDIARARVIRRQGFLGVDEAEYRVSRWLLGNYKVSGKGGGGYLFELVDVFRPLQRAIYEDLDNETFALSQNFNHSDTQIHLSDSPKGVWREPGHVLLFSDFFSNRGFELVEYQTIGGTGNKVLQTLTRRKWGVTIGVGSGNFQEDTTKLWQVWAKRGNPLDLMREWMLTTAAGGNGAFDVADGDGLGDEISDDFIDHTGIDAIRDQFWPQPTFTGDALTSGNAMLFVDKEPINDLLDFIIQNIVQPLGLLLSVRPDGRFSIDTRFRLPNVPVTIGKDWNVKGFDPSKWSRGLEGKKVNVFNVKTDWDVNEGEFVTSRTIQDAFSIDQFGKSKPQPLASRGFRTGKLGFPDFHGDSDAAIGASRVLLDTSNPSIDLDVVAQYKFRDVSMGDAVKIDIPAIPDLQVKKRGLVGGQFSVAKREVDDDKGHVKLGIRQRRLTYKPALVAPDSVSPDYSTASDADKQYCYLTNNREDFFPDGTPAYKVVPG